MFNKKKYSFWIYYASVLVVWVIVLWLAWVFVSKDRFHGVIIFFFGFWFGVLMINIARKFFY